CPTRPFRIRWASIRGLRSPSRSSSRRRPPTTWPRGSGTPRSRWSRSAEGACALPWRSASILPSSAGFWASGRSRGSSRRPVSLRRSRGSSKRRSRAIRSGAGPTARRPDGSGDAGARLGAGPGRYHHVMAPRRPVASRTAAPSAPKSRGIPAGAFAEARALVWTHRRRLAAGLALMVVSRLSDLVLPTTTKYLMDDVIARGRWELLPRLALVAGAATLVGASTSFLNSQVLGVAAQRAITEMRKQVQAHVMRLPIRYFDSTKTGILISRIMTDAEGIR